jgi:hypothetical protein
LRDRVGGAFHRLTRVGGGWRVELQIGDRRTQVEHANAEEAYGLALLHLMTGE